MFIMRDREVIGMLIEQAKQITKSIAPKYPLGYTEVFPVALHYLQECYKLDIRYNYSEIDRRLRELVAEGV